VYWKYLLIDVNVLSLNEARNDATEVVETTNLWKTKPTCCNLQRQCLKGGINGEKWILG
jgi:hypothetical protein